MTLQKLFLRARSYRSFDPSVRISDETLRSFVACARLASSSRNLQAVRFRLVSNNEECARVFPLTRWAGYLADMEIPPKGHEPTAYIVLCIDTELATVPSFQKDIGICAQSLLLAATEEELGGCMIGSFNAKEVSDALAIPEYLSPQLILALGKPDERVEITEAENGNICYYRENGVHYVPKRSLEELII
jgi:nitroreductase